MIMEKWCPPSHSYHHFIRVQYDLHIEILNFFERWRMANHEFGFKLNSEPNVDDVHCGEISFLLPIGGIHTISEMGLKIWLHAKTISNFNDLERSVAS
jgi:hypothetical protein